MFCPRCGAPNPETTKFCRQCGLSLTQVSSYVATGGTAQLTPIKEATSHLTQLTAGYSPRQKMVLTILSFIFIPAIVAIMTEPLGLEDFFVPLSALFMCIGIPWAVIHFRNQQRLLNQQQWQAHMQMQQLQPGMLMPPNVPYAPQYLQPPVQQPIQTPAQQPYVAQPVYHAPQPAPPANSPNTNPLGTTPSSVTEDETRRLQNQ